MPQKWGKIHHVIFVAVGGHDEMLMEIFFGWFTLGCSWVDLLVEDKDICKIFLLLIFYLTFGRISKIATLVEAGILRPYFTCTVLRFSNITNTIKNQFITMILPKLYNHSTYSIMQ